MEEKSSAQLNKEVVQEVPLAKLMERISVRTMAKDIAALRGEPVPPKEVVPEAVEPEKAPPPTKLPVAKPAAKPAPSRGLTAWLERMTTKENRLKLILIGLAIIVLIGGTGGFFYWWGYLREVPPPPVVTHYECQDFQCVSLQGEGIDQCQTDEDCQPVEPTVPEPLIPVDETQTIELTLGEEKWLISELNLAAEEAQASSTVRHILVKVIGPREKKYLDLESLLSALKIEVPENILAAVPTTTPETAGSNYTLFFFSQLAGNRLGLVIPIEEDSLDLMLKLWEESMRTELRPLHLSLKYEPAATEEFLDNVYRGIAIRYINFPDPTLSIDYAVVEDKLIIATSRATMYATIDALSPAEEIDTTDWQTYRNEEYGFEVKYPEEWYLNETEFGDVEFSPLTSGERHELSSEKKMIVVVSIRMARSLDVFPYIEDTTLSGLPAIKQIIEEEPESGSYKIIEVYQEDKDITVSLFIHGHLQELEEVRKAENIYLPIFDQILSTLKFIP